MHLRNGKVKSALPIKKLKKTSNDQSIKVGSNLAAVIVRENSAENPDNAIAEMSLGAQPAQPAHEANAVQIRPDQGAAVIAEQLGQLRHYVSDEQVMDEAGDEPCEEIDPSPRSDDGFLDTDLDYILGYYFWRVKEQRTPFRKGIDRVLIEYNRNPKKQNKKNSDKNLLLKLRQEKKRDWFVRKYFSELDQEESAVFRNYLDECIETLIENEANNIKMDQ